MAKEKKIVRSRKNYSGKSQNRNFSLFVFLGLLFSALVIALLLEYLDFRSGRQSFIFRISDCLAS